MKKLSIASIIVIAMLLTIGTVYGNTFTYTPTPNDLGDLDHGYYYYWQITDPTLQMALQSEQIIGATLTFKNIWDWTVERNDQLYIHLEDTRPVGGTQIGSSVRRYIDNQPSSDVMGKDAFGSTGQIIDIWNDPNGGKARNFDLIYDLAFVLPYGINPDRNLLDELTTYSSDGIFGIGIDPDCHYYNNGVTLTINTQPVGVPEPSVFFLFGSGLVGLAFFSLRRKV